MIFSENSVSIDVNDDVNKITARKYLNVDKLIPKSNKGYMYQESKKVINIAHQIIQLDISAIFM